MANEKDVTDDTAKKISQERLENMVQDINSYMTRSEAFVHTELTIVDLAKELDVHPKQISTAINTICNQNFSSYVNQFRIQKAEVLLKKQEAENLSVDGIANKVGFHSKSAFYAAFKKVTGTTPSKYKEKNAA